MKTIHAFLLTILIMAMSTTLSAQDYAGDFSWVGTNTDLSSTVVNACGVQNTVWITSTPSNHTSSAGGIFRVPNSSGDPATNSFHNHQL